MADEPGTPPTSALERKLATILSADVAAYSRLMAEDEEQTLLTFRAHTQIFESLVSLHRGRVFNTAGDAILAEFGSAVEAVRCATEIQAALRTRNDQLPSSRQVKFRIGVNLGDVMVQGTDLLGDGVNIAARLQAVAEPGGICLSGSVYDQIRNKLSLSFKSLGEQTFKNIPQPVRTFSITESENHGELPSPKSARRGGIGRPLTWVAAPALLLAVVGGYWVYSEGHRGKAEQRRKAEPARLMAEADGIYAGPVCYGPGSQDPARCYRAQATVSEGKITGSWPGRDPGVTMILAGEVSASGAVRIAIHSEGLKPKEVMIDLLGTLRSGRLDATGSFQSGRKTDLNWQRQ